MMNDIKTVSNKTPVYEMGKKPKNSGQALMIKNAKKGKVSKSPHVRYPDIDGVKKMFGINVSKKNKQK